MVELLHIGDDVKVFLKGERPWCIAIAILGEKIKVRIDSKLFNDYSEHEQAQMMKRAWNDVKPLPNLHGKTQGDEFWCEKSDFGQWIEAI